MSQQVIADDDVETSIDVEHSDVKEWSGSMAPDEPKSLVWSFNKTKQITLISWIRTLLLSFDVQYSPSEKRKSEQGQKYCFIYQASEILANKLLIGDNTRVTDAN